MVTMSRATEDYLKAIYNLAHRGEAVTTGQLAHELGVSSPSASAMIKRLEDGELLSRPDSRSLRLTDSGERAALRYLGELGLLPGVVIDVEEQDPFGGPRWIRVEGQRRSLGAPLTQLVHGHVLDGNDTDTSTYDRTRTGHDVGETP